MRVLVCGGRNYTNQPEIEYQMTDLLINSKGPHTIIAGAATGADSLAVIWARAEGHKVIEFPANWKKYGKRAGIVRNREMLLIGKPDVVLAFPGGKGTADMVALARDAGVRVIEVPK